MSVSQKESRYAKSADLINFLKNSIESKNYVTMLVAGSKPEILGPQTDLDIFTVVRDEKRDEFFENLKLAMNNYLKDYSGTKYSLYRGPLKYKNHGLIHFLCYTDEHNTDDVVSIYNENRTVLRTLINVPAISGKNLSNILSGINIYDESKISLEKEKYLKKLNILKEKGYNQHREWKKEGDEWVFEYTKKYASKFLKEYLIHYYEKNIAR